MTRVLLFAAALLISSTAYGQCASCAPAVRVTVKTKAVAVKVVAAPRAVVVKTKNVIRHRRVRLFRWRR